MFYNKLDISVSFEISQSHVSGRAKYVMEELCIIKCKII